MWLDGKLHFGTGAHEQKAKNIEANPRCVLTNGTNSAMSNHPWCRGSWPGRSGNGRKPGRSSGNTPVRLRRVGRPADDRVIVDLVRAVGLRVLEHPHGALRALRIVELPRGEGRHVVRFR
jgi:hypothetical protein